jgi:hypothetical protein
MNIKDKNKAKYIINSAINDAVTEIEEKRYYPSVREAGSAPTEDALDEFANILIKGFDEVSEIISGSTFSSLFDDMTLDDIMGDIDGKNMDEFTELEEIDQFIRDNGERKYHYWNNVYVYKPTGQHIKVETQCDTGDDFISLCGVSIVEKKQITTYEWS